MSFDPLVLILAMALTFSTTIAYGQLKAGDVAPNAIKFDLGELDNMEPFQEGFAVIQKGRSTAIINSRGEFLVPFNKYNSTGQFFNGYCLVYGTSGGGIINGRGEEVVPCGPYYKIGIPDENGWAHLDSATRGCIINLKSKKRYSTVVHYDAYHHFVKINDGYMIKFSSGLTRFRDDKTYKYGYKAISGRVVIEPQFDDAEAFSEGLAVVSKKNEFGETKYGFIDSTGKTIIPFSFSIQPGSFYKNRAFVVPKDRTEFNFGYIDRQGTLRIKLKTSEPKYSTNFKEGFVVAEYGNDPNKTVVIDTNGVEFPLRKTLTYNGQEYYFSLRSGIVSGQLMIVSGVNYGLINPRGEIIVPPIFQSVSYVDPISKLAKAKFGERNKKYVEGYINEKGVFVAIKGQASKW